VVGGTSTLHRELEEGLAALKGTQDCLLCPTGVCVFVCVYMLGCVYKLMCLYWVLLLECVTQPNCVIVVQASGGSWDF